MKWRHQSVPYEVRCCSLLIFTVPTKEGIFADTHLARVLCDTSTRYCRFNTFTKRSSEPYTTIPVVTTSHKDVPHSSHLQLDQFDKLNLAGLLPPTAMANLFPYTFISCPCSDVSRRALTSKRLSREVDLDQQIQQDEETFDSRQPRSSFSLFPPENLLYCEECHDIKCPRCVTEEINAVYCPDCLFESPKVMVRGEGNRCVSFGISSQKETSWILTSPDQCISHATATTVPYVHLR